MGIIEKLFGPSKQKIAWQQLADELGGEFTYGFGKGYRLETSFDNWSIILDTYTVSTGNSAVTYTRMRMPFVNKAGLSLKLYNAGMFSNVGKFLGMQDIEIGDAAFDEKYIIKANDAEMVKQLFSSDMLKYIIDNHPKIHIEVKDLDKGLVQPVSHEVKQLYFQETGVIKDIDRLKRLYLLFNEFIKQLIAIGAAVDESPMIKS